MSDWYEEMEEAEQEYESKLEDEALEYARAYEQGRADRNKEFQKQFDMMYADKLEQVRICERAKVIDEFAHKLKETFNNEFPSNYHCTKPYFTLDNVRVLVNVVAKELKENN